MSVCPVCKNNDATESPISAGKDADAYTCPGCGDYEITRTASEILPTRFESDGLARDKLSHWLRMSQDGEKRPSLDTALIDRVLSAPLPSAMEQAELLLRWLGQHSTYPGHQVSLPLPVARAVIGAPGAGLWYIHDHLVNEGMLVAPPRPQGVRRDPLHATLTVDGWQRFEELQRRSPDSRTVFMAMQYGQSMVEEAVEHCFRSAVQATGLELRLLRDHPRAGLIDNRLRVEIRQCVLLLADLTWGNAGAYWEAGYAEGLGRPVIYTCHDDYFNRRGQFSEAPGPHFDTNHHQTILWHEDRWLQAAEELKATIRATLPEVTKGTGS